MRVLLLAAACLLAGCSAPEAAPPAAPALDVLGDVRVLKATILPASYGNGTPAAPLRVLVGGEEMAAPEGTGISLALWEGGARLRLVHHGEWVRTSLRTEDPACVVTLRTSTVDSTVPPGIPLDNAIGPGWPYHDYAFSGTCAGRLFLLWRG